MTVPPHETRWRRDDVPRTRRVSTGYSSETEKRFPGMAGRRERRFRRDHHRELVSPNESHTTLPVGLRPATAKRGEKFASRFPCSPSASDVRVRSTVQNESFGLSVLTSNPTKSSHYDRGACRTVYKQRSRYELWLKRFW